MKIVIAHIMGKWNGGGVESIVLNYYENIDREKFEFHFLCDSDSKYIPYDKINKLGGKVILLPPYQKILKYQKSLKKIILENNYNIIHSHINTLSVFPLKVAKECNVKIRISHSHNTTNNKEKIRNIIKLFLKLFSKKYANYYFACSNKAGKFLFNNHDYFLLNNAINLDKFKYDKNIRNKYREELNISSDTLVFGHIGRFAKQKNHEFLIDIFKEINSKNNNTMLLLIGNGPLIKKIKKKVKKLNLEKYVRFLGQRNDVNNLYQVFDVFLLPSLYEGLPVVLIEAISSNLPCFISTNITNEINIVNNINFISLNKGSSEWANMILNKYKNYKRKSNVSLLTKHGYNIKEEVKKLEIKYQDIYSHEVLNEKNNNSFS